MLFRSKGYLTKIGILTKLNKIMNYLAGSLSVHVHELGEVEPGPLHDLALPDVNVVERVDALAGLHDVAGDGVGDQLVDNSLEVIGGNLLGDDVNHLLTDVAHLNINYT